MSMDKVRNMALLSQPVLNEGLVFGKCGMTDIDLSCDWQGKYFVFVELKWGTAMLPMGQKFHLEGLVKAIRAGGRRATAILAHHMAQGTDPIMAADALVTRIYQGKGWERVPGDVCVKDYMTGLHKAYLESRT